MHLRLSIRAYLALLGVVSLLLAVLATALPHDPYIRYQSTKGTIFERTRYLYERLHFDPTPIDVVFIGSSRTAGGVDPEVLEQQLEQRGLNLHVANLSMPASGMDIRVVEAREALRSHPEIKLMVISVVEAFPRDGHQAFGDLATTGDILGSPWLVNRNLPDWILRLPMRQIKLFAASLLPDAFGYTTTFDPELYPGTTAAASDLPGWQPNNARFLFRSEGHRREVASESAMRQREITPPILPESLAGVEFGVSRKSLQTLVNLARETDTQLVFLYLPFYDGYAKPREADWLSERAPFWNAAFFRTDASNYRDAAHASPLGVPKLNAWLADRIAGQLGGGNGAAAGSGEE